MTETENAEYGVIVSDQHFYSVWTTRRDPPPGWHFTRHVGTQSEMQALVQQKQEFVATTPSMHIGEDRRYRDTFFALTES